MTMKSDRVQAPLNSHTYAHIISFKRLAFCCAMSLELSAVPAHFSSSSRASCPPSPDAMLSARSLPTASRSDSRSPRMMI